MLSLVMLLASTAAPQSPWPDAHARRTYQLGITLSEFRAIPYPDQQGWPNAYPVCTDEARSEKYPYRGEDLNISEDWKAVGVIKCTFFYDGRFGLSSAGLMLGDFGSHTEFAFISEDGQKEPRLFLIKSGGPTGKFEDLVSAFSVALGKPSKVEKAKVQNRVGNAFENETVVWQGKSSRVELERYAATLRILEVRHILEPLDGIFVKKLAERTAIKAHNL
jgi:hypothetical protein